MSVQPKESDTSKMSDKELIAYLMKKNAQLEQKNLKTEEKLKTALADAKEAKTEARILMLGSNNILKPSSGDPIVTPSQDMVLGNYYITMEKAGLPGEGRIFKDVNEALMAYERKELTLHTRIAIVFERYPQEEAW